LIHIFKSGNLPWAGSIDSKLAANGADQIHQGCSGLPEIKVFVVEIWKWETINFVLLTVVIKSYLFHVVSVLFNFDISAHRRSMQKKAQSL